MSVSGGGEERPAEPYPSIDDAAELLFREVHPDWIEEGVPSYQAFCPTRKDDGMLSIARASKTTASGAHRHYTEVLGFRSAGTWGLSVAEVLAAPVTWQDGTQSQPLSARDHPLVDDPAHGFIDFRGVGGKPCIRLGRVLLARAVDRGQLHP